MAIGLVDHKRTKNNRINIRNIETQVVEEHGRGDGMKTRQDGGTGEVKKPAVKSRAGLKKPGCETERSIRAKKKLDILFDIGLSDERQPKESMPFLLDMRGDRKACLPPIVAPLGIERRRDERKKREAKREKKEAAARFKAISE